MPLISLLKEDIDWCVYRMKESVRYTLKHNPRTVFVAGGFIRSCLSNEKINDIDLFCQSQESARARADCLRAQEGRAMHESPNAFTVKTQPYTTQFIHRWTFETPEQCIESFDFTIAKAAIWWDGEAWRGVCDARFYADLACKRLIYCSPIRDEEAGGSMLRVLKFYQRGFRIPMDSLGAVIARIATAAGDAIVEGNEALTPIITSLLREVDPQIDPEHQSHLPSVMPTPFASLNQELDVNWDEATIRLNPPLQGYADRNGFMQRQEVMLQSQAEMSDHQVEEG